MSENIDGKSPGQRSSCWAIALKRFVYVRTSIYIYIYMYIYIHTISLFICTCIQTQHTQERDSTQALFHMQTIAIQMNTCLARYLLHSILSFTSCLWFQTHTNKMHANIRQRVGLFFKFVQTHNIQTPDTKVAHNRFVHYCSLFFNLFFFPANQHRQRQVGAHGYSFWKGLQILHTCSQMSALFDLFNIVLYC